MLCVCCLCVRVCVLPTTPHHTHTTPHHTTPHHTTPHHTTPYHTTPHHTTPHHTVPIRSRGRRRGGCAAAHRRPACGGVSAVARPCQCPYSEASLRAQDERQSHASAAMSCCATRVSSNRRRNAERETHTHMPRLTSLSLFLSFFLSLSLSPTHPPSFELNSEVLHIIAVPIRHVAPFRHEHLDLTPLVPVSMPPRETYTQAFA